MFLFDTNAIAEPLRPKPNADYVAWLRTLAPEVQYTSIIVVAELYAGAHSSRATAKWVRRISEEILPSLSVLDFDLECAIYYGRIHAVLRRRGTPIGDVVIQIAATAIRHNLTVVTANAEHFNKVPGLKLRTFSPGAKGEAGGGTKRLSSKRSGPR